MTSMNGAGKSWVNGADLNGADRLYGWWLDAVPHFLSGLTPRPTATESAAEDAAAAPSPIGHITQALGLAQRLMKPVSEAMLQALALNQSGQAAQLCEDLLQGWTSDVADRLTTTNPAACAQPFERTFGGLVDAFGLASSRDLQQALRDMTAASIAQQKAQTEYLGLVVSGLAKGSHALIARLTEMGRRGESVDSVKSLLRLWARAADGEMHVQMQSPAALELSARLVRAATRSRQQQHRIVAIASQALNVPTRAEVDDAYREIQELKRELRRLRRSLESDSVGDATAAAAQPPVARTPRKAPAKASPQRAKPLAGRKTSAARKAGQKADLK